MSTEGYAHFEDPYTYPGTSVLQNLLDIRDQDTLDAFEVEISTLRAEEPLPEGTFDADHYCRVHHHLFQDIYAWAGKYRSVRISKGANTFCFPEHIPAQMTTLFDQLRGGEIFADRNAEEFVESLTHFLSELNAIHPFREGNGRSQLSFLGLIGATFDHPIAFERLNCTTFLPAMIASFDGNLSPLRLELRTLLG